MIAFRFDPEDIHAANSDVIFPDEVDDGHRYLDDAVHCRRGAHLVTLHDGTGDVVGWMLARDFQTKRRDV